jgi:hypothetical protein
VRFVDGCCGVEAFFVGWWDLAGRVGWSLLAMDWMD